MESFKAQLQRNQVALISLVIACMSLGYTSWRNELTEANRNSRLAGFEMIREIAGVERVLFFSHYDQDQQAGNPRQGWSHVLAIQDLSRFLDEDVQAKAKSLHVIWQQRWPELGRQQAAADSISSAIDALRSATLSALSELE